MFCFAAANEPEFSSIFTTAGAMRSAVSAWSRRMSKSALAIQTASRLPYAEADLVVGPEALVKIRREEGGEGIARLERRFDLLLPLPRRLNVVVRDERIHRARQKVSLDSGHAFLG